MLVLAHALRRLLARLAPSAPGLEDPPEVFEVERRAAVAMTSCTCGHMWHLHEHLHARTGCDACRCERFRPSQPAPLSAAPQPRPADDALIRLRVALWTRAWRDRRDTDQTS